MVVVVVGEQSQHPFAAGRDNGKSAVLCGHRHGLARGAGHSLQLASVQPKCVPRSIRIHPVHFHRSTPYNAYSK